MIHPMTEAERRARYGSVRPMDRTYKHLRPRNAVIMLALAVLAWVPVALVLS